jgi:release factor glutamine methyltransferase
MLEREPMTVREILLEASTKIARRDVETLLAHLLGQPRTHLLTHPEATLNAPTAADLQTLIDRRATGEPLQYLTGTQEFFGLAFRVTPAVLIPRPETEHLVEAVLAWAVTQPQPLRLADIGTGSGAIAIAIAANLPTAEIIATDISPAALEVARENAAHLGFSDRIRFEQADLLGTLATPLDAIVSNPPYIPTTDAPTLQREVIAHEPHTALFAGPDGLEIYRRLIPAAYAALRPGGLLAMEIGFGQRIALTQLLEIWLKVQFIEDYAGIPRVVLAQHP